VPPLKLAPSRATRLVLTREHTKCDGRSDIDQDARQRQVFLTPLTLPVASQIKAQRRDVSLGQSGGQSGEEAAFLPRHTPAMYQDHCLTSTVWQDKSAGQVETIRRADGRGSLLRHV
jgi:hypothetical protein